MKALDNNRFTTATRAHIRDNVQRFQDRQQGQGEHGGPADFLVRHVQRMLGGKGRF